MPKGTSGNNAQFTYDFGIAIAQGTLRKIERLTGTTLTLAGAFYALKSSAAEYVDTLKKNTLIFGGQLSTIKAMEQAQDRLLKGISHFSMTDQLEGMKRLAASGIDARKNLEWIDKAAHATGKSFSEFSGAIASAIQGNMSGLVDMGLITQRATRLFDKYQANTIMRQQAILNFVKQHKGLQNAIINDFDTIKDQMRRLGAAWKTFLYSIIGNPSDPGSLYGTIAGTFKNIADAISRSKLAIQNAGLAIGMTLSWVVRNVGHVVMWMGRQVKKAIDMVGLASENFADKLRSFFVWLEFWKVHIVNFFRKYQDQIKTALKWTLILIGAMKSLKFAFGTKFGKAFLTYLEDDLRSGVGFFKAFFGNLWVMVTARLSRIGSVVGKFFGGISKWITLITKGLANSLRAVMSLIKANPYVAIAVAAITLITSLYKKFEGVRKVVNTIVGIGIEGIRFIWNLLNGIYVTARVGLRAIGNFFVEYIWTPVKNFYSNVWSWISSACGWIGRMWDAFMDTRVGKWLHIHIIDPLKRVFEWISGLWTKLLNGLSKVFPWLRKKNNDFAQTVKEWGEENGIKTATWTNEKTPDVSRDYLSFGGKQNPIVSAQTPAVAPETGTSTMNFNNGAIQIVVKKGEGIDENKLAQKVKQAILDMQRDGLIRAGAL